MDYVVDFAQFSKRQNGQDSASQTQSQINRHEGPCNSSLRTRLSRISPSLAKRNIGHSAASDKRPPITFRPLSSGLPAQGISLSIVAVYLGERGRPARSLANDIAFSGTGRRSATGCIPGAITSSAAGLSSFSQ